MRKIAYLLSFVILFGLMGQKTQAMEEKTINVSVINEETGDEKNYSIPIETFATNRKKVKSAGPNKEITEEGSFYVEVLKDDVNILTEEDYEKAVRFAKSASGTITDSSSTTGTYWKATVSITYSVNGDYCTFSKVGASWSQQHGNSTLSNRMVYWGGTLGLTFNCGTYYPTSNSVSYNTNWGATKFGGGSLIGCNSSATYTTYAGASFTISADISHEF